MVLHNLFEDTIITLLNKMKDLDPQDERIPEQVSKKLFALFSCRVKADSLYLHSV